MLQSRRINRYRVNRYTILNRYAFWSPIGDLKNFLNRYGFL